MNKIISFVKIYSIAVLSFSASVNISDRLKKPVSGPAYFEFKGSDSMYLFIINLKGRVRANLLLKYTHDPPLLFNTKNNLLEQSNKGKFI